MNNSSNSWPTCERFDYQITAELQPYRHLARDNPAAFIRFCLTDPSGYALSCAEVHDDLQAFLSAHRHALVELPRDHGKSTQVCGRIIWELGKNPALRVKIICATDAIAAERSRFIRNAIAHNLRLRHVFPRLRPGKPWTVEAFSVRRPGEVIGPSVAAVGVGTGSTGTRADLLICDDVVDVRSLHSKAERERVAEYFTNNLMNLLEPDGRFWGIFTPWHRDDLNARLKRNPAYALFSRAVGEHFEPVWAEKWPMERLRARKEEIGTASFARGYRLQPVSDEDTPIRAAWVKFWTDPAEYEQVVLSVDPAVSTATRADRSALVVLGKTAQRSMFSTSPGFAGEVGESSSRVGVSASTLGSAFPPTQQRSAADLPLQGGGESEAPQIHVLATRAARLSAPELVAFIDEFDRVYQPAVILFESNAAFLGMKELLARQTRFGPKLKGVTQTADKMARIAAFSVAIENGAFRLRGSAMGDCVDESQRELFEEMITFPYDDHDDLVDAAATGCAYLLERREPCIW